MINRPKPLLCVEHIEKYYGNQGSVTKALNQVSFYVQHGEFVSRYVKQKRLKVIS